MKKIRVCTGDYTLVDPDIYELFADDFWHYDGVKVFKGKEGGRNESLHRYIMGTPPGHNLVIDHADRNPLNNLRSNLRFATYAQNSYNRSGGNHKGSTSKYKGVSKVGKKWRASISKDGKKIHLGYFNCERNAAIAYNHKAKELFGEFAYLNHVEGENHA
jgi:hypothetical protein